MDARQPAVDTATAGAKATKDRRQQLPTVPLLTTLPFFNTAGKDYSRFALSPLAPLSGTGPSPSKSLLRGDWTPVTAVRLWDRSPVIAGPENEVGMSLLERYLAEHHDPPPAIQPLPSPPMTLQKAGLSDTLQTPDIWTPWTAIVGSPPESTVDCCSPVAGRGPPDSPQQEEQLYDPPMDINSEADTNNTLIEDESDSQQSSKRASKVIDVPAQQTIVPRRNSLPEYETKDKLKAVYFVPTNSEGISAAPKSAPLDLRQDSARITTTEIPTRKARKRRGRSSKTKRGQPSDSSTSNQPEAVIGPTSASADDPSSGGRKPFKHKITSPVLQSEEFAPHPPPAPTIERFPEEFPASPHTAKPSPIDTSLSPRCYSNHDTPISPRMQYAMLPKGHLEAILSSLGPGSPPPAPTQLNFGVALPASPLRSKPAPIDTTSPIQESRKSDAADEGVGDTPGLPPPPPMQEGFTFSPRIVSFLASPLPGVNFEVPISPIPRPTAPGPHVQALSRNIRKSSAAKFGDGSNPSTPFTPAFWYRGRSPSREGRGVKDSQFWRSTRSQSPPRSPRLVQDFDSKPKSIPILPNTVYDPKRDQVFVTKDQVLSDKYFILRTYHNRKAASPARKERADTKVQDTSSHQHKGKDRASTPVGKARKRSPTMKEYAKQNDTVLPSKHVAFTYPRIEFTKEEW